MRRGAPLVGGALVALGLGLLAWSVAASPRWGTGLTGAVLLALSLGALILVSLKQRRRLHRARRALARSRLRADACIEASPDGVVILSGGTIVSANPAFRSLLAVPPDEEIAGRSFASLLAPAERGRVGSWIEERQAGRAEPTQLDFLGLRLTGLEIPLEAASALLPEEEGSQLALFVRDVSSRRAVEKRVRHLDRVEALSDVAEMVAGEFEGILTRLRRTAREREAAPSERNVASLEAIERLASRGLALVRRVRSFAPGTVDKGAQRPLELVRLVRDTAGDFLRGLPSELNLRVESVDEARLVVRGDPPQLRQALWHILDNARDAQQRGEIQLRTRGIDLDAAMTARHPGSQPGSYALVEVRDTGGGMSEQVRVRAFQPFFTTKGGRASGLGLTAATATVRAHGGFVEIDSEPERGTIVKLALPRLEDGALPSEEDALGEAGENVRGHENVLVVDDDLAGREAARTALEPYGYHVEEAATPREALERMRHKPLVDLVLLDMVLPGWTGLDVLRRIHRIWPDQRVIMVSPYPLPDQESQALRLGAAGCARKPLTGPTLARRVREALDRPPPPPAIGEPR